MPNAYFSFYDSAGRIRSVSCHNTDEDLSDEYPVDGGALETGYIDAAKFWVDGGDLIDRPTLDIDPEYTIATGTGTVEFEIPDGTTVMVVSLDERKASANGSSSYIEDVAGATDDYIFSSKRRGEFELTVTPPFPYQVQKIIVKVT